MQDLKDIIRQCQSGNALAWESLIRQHQARVYGVAYYFMRNAADAQDVSQEVFIKIYKSLKSYQVEQTEFVPWMLKIARNCCIDRLRSAKTRNQHEGEYRSAVEELVGVDKTPEIELSEAERADQIYAVLGEFSEENRDIILLKDIQGMKNQDVAEILSLPLGTIKSRANRARIKLAKALSRLRAAEDL